MARDAEHGTVTYEVFLREGDAASPTVQSPVETSRIDFYDSGIWIEPTSGGRDFYPWDRVDLIHERPAPARADQPVAEPTADRDDDVEGDVEPGIPEEDPGPLA